MTYGAVDTAVITFNSLARVNPTLKYERLGAMALENRHHYCERHGYRFIGDVDPAPGGRQRLRRDPGLRKPQVPCCDPHCAQGLRAQRMRDRDSRFGAEFDRAARSAGIKVVLTAARTPLLNATCERFLGSARRECLDHVILLGRRHLKLVLRAYSFGEFSTSRLRQGIGQRVPAPRLALGFKGVPQKHRPPWAGQLRLAVRSRARLLAPMRVAFHPTLLGISLLVGLRAAAAFGATLYVAPHGAGEACTRDSPCALGSGATRAVAGDTVILMDGIYREPLHPENSGTPEAWITFRADDCALPVLEGPGESFDQDSEADGPSGVASTTGTYLRFEGIVSRYWDSGFTNGWTGQGTTDSNGHIEYVNCIGDGNWRTGLVMYSAGGITIRECIAAHNGGSPSRSWSSGIQLYAVQGTADENVVERSVSFENTDAQKRNDGSGFIVDEYTQGATFLNNIGFRNGGSCMRLTRSGNTRMVNFSCYHNAMNPHPNSPGDPGEFYFTDDVSREGSVVTNALAAASGTPADRAVMLHAPATGVTNNVIVNEGAAPFFSDPEGEHPDFRPPVSAAGDVEDQGTVQNAPQVDIGFDPQCIVKRDPGVPFQQSWWQYAIDYDYVRSIGGVARCFHPKPRTGGVDVGAYELSGEPHQFSPPGSCVPGTSGPSGDGAGGAAAANGTPGDDTGAAASPTPATPEHSDGCSCRVAGSRIAASPGLLALVAATALACARRRRRASVLCP